MLYVVCGFGLITCFFAVHEYLKMNMMGVRDCKVFKIGITYNSSIVITILYHYLCIKFLGIDAQQQ